LTLGIRYWFTSLGLDGGLRREKGRKKDKDEYRHKKEANWTFLELRG